MCEIALVDLDVPADDTFGSRHVREVGGQALPVGTIAWVADAGVAEEGLSVDDLEQDATSASKMLRRALSRARAVRFGRDAARSVPRWMPVVRTRPSSALVRW